MLIIGAIYQHGFSAANKVTLQDDSNARSILPALQLTVKVPNVKMKY